MCAINDPLGQTHSPALSEHYSHLKVVLFCDILKSGDGRKDGQTTPTLWIKNYVSKGPGKEKRV